MSLAKLLLKLTVHYARRGFPATAIAALQTRIAESIIGSKLEFRGDYDFSGSIDQLAEWFPVCPMAAETAADVANSDTIFAFAFGYRRKTRPAPGEETRLPGSNNRALAEICSWLKSSWPTLRLCVQFEIADALADYTDSKADFSTRADDIGTSAVINAFLADSPRPQRVVVVAHRHHVDRCHILLREDFGLDSISAPRHYDGYDKEEAQPRVTTPGTFIVSDFVSLAGRAIKKMTPPNPGPPTDG